MVQVHGPGLGSMSPSRRIERLVCGLGDLYILCGGGNQLGTAPLGEKTAGVWAVRPTRRHSGRSPTKVEEGIVATGFAPPLGGLGDTTRRLLRRLLSRRLASWVIQFFISLF